MEILNEVFLIPGARNGVNYESNLFHICKDNPTFVNFTQNFVRGHEG